MKYVSPLTLLARALDDEKKYPRDPDPRHWRTIEHSHVHIDKGGHIDGGAGGKFTGKAWTSAKHPHKAEGYPEDPKPATPPAPPTPPPPPPKTAEDLRTAWKAVAKERMEIHRAKTEKSKKAHEEKLDKAFKAYTDMRSEIEARDPAEAAKFRPTTGGAAGSKKTVAGGALGALAAATAPPAATSTAGATTMTSATTTPTTPTLERKDTPETRKAAEGFGGFGVLALVSYGRYKITGDPADLKDAKEKLKKAEEKIKTMPADSKAFKKAREKVLERAKLEGLLSDSGGKLKDIFREIKTATMPTTAPTPATPAPATPKSPLESLVEATSGRTPSGATEAECTAGRAKVPELKVYDKHRKTVEDAEYSRLRFSPAERAEFEEGIRRIFMNSDYGMNIKPSKLELVLKSKFKSQYETGTSGGACSDSAVAERAKIFGALLGTKKYKASDFPDASREKYGSMVTKDLSDIGASSYGSCVVRFKKERLAGRATYTAGDSLNQYGWESSTLSGKMAAGDADHPTIAGFIKCRDYDKATLLKAVRTCKNIKELRRELSMPEYMEMQYHGDVTADDIGSVVFRTTPSASLVKALKARGIEVYMSYGSGAKRI